jgi:hypothetical protein
MVEVIVYPGAPRRRAAPAGGLIAFRTTGNPLTHQAPTRNQLCPEADRHQKSDP